MPLLQNATLAAFLYYSLMAHHSSEKRQALSSYFQKNIEILSIAIFIAFCLEL